MASQPRIVFVLRIGLILAMIALIVGGVRTYRKPRTSPEVRDLSEITGLYVDPKQLSFGEAWEDDHFTWTVQIENRKGSDVTIERFYNSCVCTEISPQSLVIPAGQSREIRLVIDLRSRYGYKESTGAVRNFAVSVGAIVAGPDGERVDKGWDVQGRVKRAIEFEQPEIDFGTHSERESPLPARRISVQSLATLDSLMVTGGLTDFPVKVIRNQASPSSLDLEIGPVGPLVEAQYNFALSVTPVLPDGTRLPPYKLPVRATIVPDVQAFPPEIQFGAVQLGEMAETIMTLASLTGKAFTVKDWNSSSGEVIIGLQGDNQREPVFQVQWKQVMSLGEHKSEVVIRIETDKKEEKVVRVPIKCLGIEKATASLK